MKVLTLGCGLFVILSYFAMGVVASLPSRISGILVSEGIHLPLPIQNDIDAGIHAVERLVHIWCVVSLFLFVYGAILELKALERLLAAGKGKGGAPPPLGSADEGGARDVQPGVRL